MFSGSWEEMCYQALALAEDDHQKYFYISVDDPNRAERASVLVRNLDDLKAAGTIRGQHQAVVGRIKRWVAVLDDRGERAMHLTLPNQEHASLLEALFGHQPNENEVYCRTETHTVVIEMSVAKLNAMDPGRVGSFFRKTAAAALHHNKLG